MLFACGSGGGGSDGTGELSIHLTDAKPLLPEGATNLTVTLSEILVHKSGGGWISLPLTEDPPHIIDLLQFTGGNTTEIVPPVLLEHGKYTQIRLVIDEKEGAKIKFRDDPNQYQLEIRPEHLKTDTNFSFDLEIGGAKDIVIDFDLSRSLIVTDNGSGTLSYQLKPVLHTVDFWEAATITGTIADTSFSSPDAIITVFDTNNEVYTKLTVEKDNPNDVGFSIFWLVPNKNYRVEIDLNPNLENGLALIQEGNAEFREDVNAADLDPGEVWVLNKNDPI